MITPMKEWIARVIDALLVLLCISLLAFFFHPAFFDSTPLKISMILFVPIMTFLIERITHQKTAGFKLARGSLVASCSVILVLGSVLAVGITCQDLINSSESEFFAGKDDMSDEKWSEYSPEEKGYTIEFPGKTVAYRNDLPIPRSSERLPFYDVRCKKDGDQYSISYVVLPARWLKWNSILVMKGALKVITRHIPGAKILKTSKRSFNKLPSIEFIVSMRDNREVAGRLILVKNRLYKIEVAYPKSKKAEMQPLLNRFIHSFNPK